MDFQQSKTYANILSSYEQELMVSTLYRIFADKAKSEEYIEIGQVFDEIALNEFEHARILLKQMNNGIIPSTENNLLTSAYIEVAARDFYRNYADIAQEEGYIEIAALFNGLANIELNHDLIFKTYHGDMIRNEVVCKPENTLWICMQCGNIMSGTCAPDVCPVCGFPQGYYRVYINPEEL